MDDVMAFLGRLILVVAVVSPLWHIAYGDHLTFGHYLVVGGLLGLGVMFGTRP